MKAIDRSCELHAFDLRQAPGVEMYAGIDEAGRGPLFGPVFAACVVLRPDALIPFVFDSKKITPKRREALFEDICGTAAAVGVGWCDAREIDGMNIRNATREAMRRAAADAEAKLGAIPGVYMIDYERGLGLRAPELAFIKGDLLSQCVAAASVAAKVTRDRLMAEYDQRYPGYGLARHMGYGTRAHFEALRRLGPTPDHRKTFLRKLGAQ